jgi:hypothetical protein
MRRWIAIVMLMLLPAQMSWAAVAAYCAHERSGAAAPHVGHHDHGGHAHALAAASSEAADEGAAPSASPDADCGHCHGHCTALPVPHGEALLPSGTASHASILDAPWAVRADARPERPQWAGLA